MTASKMYKVCKITDDGKITSVVMTHPWLKTEYHSGKRIRARIGAFFVFDNLLDAEQFAEREKKGVNLEIWEVQAWMPRKKLPNCYQVYNCSTEMSYFEYYKSLWKQATLKYPKNFWPRGTRVFKEIMLTKKVKEKPWKEQ